MLHGVEVTRLDAMDHSVELPGRAQRGVSRGREVDAIDHDVEVDAVYHGVATIHILFSPLSSSSQKTDHQHWIQYFDHQKFDLIHRS